MNHSNKAFTLIELLVVIAIIGILSGLVFVSIEGVQERSRDASIKREMSQLTRSVEIYRLSNQGNYTGLESYGEASMLIEGINSKGGTVTPNITNDAYCLTSELNSTEDKWCIDSTGFSGIGDCSEYQCTTGEVTPSQQTPSISISDAIKVYGDSDFTITHSTNSDGTKSFSSSNPSVATITNAGLVTIVGAGTTTITFNTTETSTYYAGSNTATLTVNLGTTSCSVTSITKIYGDSDFTITHSTNSDGALTFESNNASTASINSSTGLVTLGNAGTATITMNIASTPTYEATSCTGVVTVNKATPTCSVSPNDKIIGDPAYTVNYSTNSDGAKSFNSSDTSVASINSSTGLITITGVGSSTITMNIAASTNYNTASCVGTQVVNVLANESICNNNENCLSGNCYFDEDGDGYEAINPTTKYCQSSASLGLDCCDTDSRVFPGQSSYFTTINNCGTWDYSCSGSVEKEPIACDIYSSYSKSGTGYCGGDRYVTLQGIVGGMTCGSVSTNCLRTNGYGGTACHYGYPCRNGTWTCGGCKTSCSQLLGGVGYTYDFYYGNKCYSWCTNCDERTCGCR
ncbi:MAG: CHU large protein [Parcubacteria bacterium 33_209]|nr:MAG: CHU large protein [Parcubacteria bacterium 33_209]